MKDRVFKPMPVTLVELRQVINDNDISEEMVRMRTRGAKLVTVQDRGFVGKIKRFIKVNKINVTGVKPHLFVCCCCCCIKAVPIVKLECHGDSATGCPKKSVPKNPN